MAWEFRAIFISNRRRQAVLSQDGKDLKSWNDFVYWSKMRGWLFLEAFYAVSLA